MRIAMRLKIVYFTARMEPFKYYVIIFSTFYTSLVIFYIYYMHVYACLAITELLIHY